jgi:hypothetical protein
VRNPQEPRDGVAGHLDDEGLSACAYSPQQAAPAALEHAADCAECSAQIEELSLLLASLADLPEPEVPASVLIRLDATLEQAWQEADAAAAAPAQTRADRSRRTRRGWRRLAVPIAAFGVLGGSVVGIGVVLGRGSLSSSSGTSASAAGVVPGTAPDDPTLTAMVREAMTVYNRYAQAGAATQVAPAPAATTSKFGASGVAPCIGAPSKPGYTLVGTAPETYAGRSASLVIYRMNEEPASTTTFYAVLYAGSCPGSSGPTLEQGAVSVSR